MAERSRLVDESVLNYEGLFSVHDLMRKIDTTIERLGYMKREAGYTEKIKESGKEIAFAIEPWKNVTTYAKYILDIKFSITGMKDTVTEMDGKRYKLQQGKVRMVISSFVETKLEHHWSRQPFYYFILGFIDRYIWTIRWYSLFANYGEAVNDDLGKFKHEILTFLNNYKYKTKQATPYIPGSQIPDRIKMLKDKESFL